MHPPSSHRTGAGRDSDRHLRLTAIPVVRTDSLHVQASHVPGGISVHLRLDREARAWLRRWLDETDNPSPLT